LNDTPHPCKSTVFAQVEIGLARLTPGTKKNAKFLNRLLKKNGLVLTGLNRLLIKAPALCAVADPEVLARGEGEYLPPLDDCEVREAQSAEGGRVWGGAP